MLHRSPCCGSLPFMEIEDVKEKSDSATVYEISYLIFPSIAMEQVSSKAIALKEMLTSFGSVIISDENPSLIDLAYPMIRVVGTTRHKVTSSYFGWVKFEISSEGIEAVKKSLDANPEIVRYLIIKTVRENTLLNGKMKLQKEDRGKKEEIESVTENVVPEAIKESMPEETDKSIDDLVIA